METVVGLTAIAVALLIGQAEPALFSHQTTIAGFLFVEAVSSLLGASSYVPLFIALSLLADEGWILEPGYGDSLGS